MPSFFSLSTISRCKNGTHEAFLSYNEPADVKFCVKVSYTVLCISVTETRFEWSGSSFTYESIIY